MTLLNMGFLIDFYMIGSNYSISLNIIDFTSIRGAVKVALKFAPITIGVELSCACSSCFNMRLHNQQVSLKVSNVKSATPHRSVQGSSRIPYGLSFVDSFDP